MVRLLRFANYSEIGRALGVGGAAVQKWARGQNVGAYQVERVERLYAETFGTVGESDAPPWAEALTARIIAEVRTMKGETIAETVTRVFDAIESSELVSRPPGGSSPGHGGRPASKRGASAPRPG